MYFGTTAGQRALQHQLDRRSTVRVMLDKSNWQTHWRSEFILLWFSTIITGMVLGLVSVIMSRLPEVQCAVRELCKII